MIKSPEKPQSAEHTASTMKNASERVMRRSRSGDSNRNEKNQGTQNAKQARQQSSAESAPRLNVHTAIGFGIQEQSLADERDLQLLGYVHRDGSITAAARAVGVTYKTAWDRLRNLQERLGHPVIIPAKGGRGGGRTLLSDTGQALLRYYQQLRREQDRAIEPEVGLDSVNDVSERPIPLRRTSARNHLSGVVAAIRRDGIRDEIRVSLHDSLQVSVNITRASTLALGLKKSVPVYLLIKAPALRFTSEHKGQTNVFRGEIRHIRRNQKQLELEVQIAPEVNLVAVTATDAGRPLKKGDEVWIQIDPDTVILGID